MMKRSLFLLLAFGLIVLGVTGTLWAQVTITTSNSYQATAENNGRRMVRDKEDTRHLVYEDIDTTVPPSLRWKDPVMYTYSSDGVTWSPPVTIAVGGTWSTDANPSICIHDTSAKQSEILHVVWSGPNYPDTSTGEIFYSSSVVGSGVWSPPINISNSPGLTSLLPSIAIDSSDGIHVVWQEDGDEEIYYTYLATLGGMWSAPINISNTSAQSERATIANTIDYSSDKIHVAWYDYSPDCGYPTPFIAYRNYDPATGWSPPLANVPLDATSGTTGLFPCISVGPDDNPHVVWDHGYSAGDVYHATSTDGGTTWNVPVLVYSTNNPFPNASVANITSDSLHLVWSECDTLINPNWYEIYHMVSADDGATFYGLQLVSTGDENWSQFPNLAYKMVLHDSCDIVWTDLDNAPYLVKYRRKPFPEQVWYFKPGYHDYAISGMPDFDQKQDRWDNPPGSGNWTYCGPTAIANCFWWFDSKYQWLINPGSPQPPNINDDFDLVTAYGTYDDHDRPNVQPFIEDLAWYMDTDGQRTGDAAQGTNVFEMEAAIAEWFLETETDTIFYKHTKKAPDFYWIEEEIERCEDVILLLGFWQSYGPREWFRIGGHYVTCAGVNSDSLAIAFSDPYYDTAELGWPGRVGNGILISPHPPAPHGPGIHNDAGNVSHDFYRVIRDSLSPGGPWSIPYYPREDSILYDLQFANCPPEFDSLQVYEYDPGLPVHTEIEYAVAISPIPDCWHYKGEYPDYAPDGMPDFDQNQHGWTGFCGPTAVANCLWWFDSKYQWLTDPGEPPPPYAYDTFNLVTSYITGYDDHSYEQDAAGWDNVQYLIEDLAGYMATDAINGTKLFDMQDGIEQWLMDRGLDTLFYEHTLIDSTRDPEFFNIIEWEIEKCQDVILLLGFWQEWETDYWVRVGGHYVTCAGVCSDSMKIMFSDPDFDQQEITYPDSVKWHNNAALVSHDVYRVAPSLSPGGYWGIPLYPDEVARRHPDENCPAHLQTYPQDDPLPGLPIFTEIEAAVFVSPFVAPAAVESLRIYPDGAPWEVNDIRLKWAPVITSYQGNPQPADDYVVYRDTVPNFTPGPAKVLTTTTATEYEDVNAAGNTAVNYFYIVTARKSGYESAPSGCVGEFDIDLGNGLKGRAREIRQSRPR